MNFASSPSKYVQGGPQNDGYTWGEMKQPLSMAKNTWVTGVIDVIVITPIYNLYGPTL